MKSGGTWRHFVLALLLAVVCYSVFYYFIEHRRVRKGPWEITFTNSAGGTPTLIINQPKLAITNVQITFPDQTTPRGAAYGKVLFDQAQPVPYDVPFGKCIFLDTTFLPGTVTLRLFGHEVELLPRVLVIDRQEHPWLSGTTNVALHPPRANGSREGTP